MSENRYQSPPGRPIVEGVMDADHCYRVASSRDGRFDGTFVTAVLTTGIYCRPSCPAMTPRRENVRFYPTPAAAQEAGFRACKRCRPDAAPGSPEWDARADLVARTVRLIGDGVVEREGIGGLSSRLGYSTRQLHRLVAAELGTGPLRLAMAHRVQNARALLETTDLPVTDVAWAAGFGSIRQFNDRIREVYALSPSEIRRRGRAAASGSRPFGTPQPGIPQPGTPESSAHTIVANLTYRPPLDLTHLLGFLGRRAVPGVEEWDGDTYTRILDLPHGFGVVTLTEVTPNAARGRDRPATKRTSHPALPCLLRLTDIRDYSTAVCRVRRLLDLDADPQAIAEALGDSPALGPLVTSAPGRRLPGAADGFEMAVRAVVGQQVSLGSARSACGRIAADFGRPVEDDGRTWNLFPDADALAGADPERLPVPRRRAATVVALAREVADGRVALHPGADRDETERRLMAVPGIGPWTAAYIRMRALGDPDVFLPGDLGLERWLGSVPDRPDPATWKPWRSYAAAHIWATAAPTTPTTTGTTPTTTTTTTTGTTTTTTGTTANGRNDP
jgi:AraC family transcriptional regulator of adaptative response / DNA-3-methyladenine glycosylase II